MFSSKLGWYLPFAILTVTFLLYVSVGLWFTEWISSGYNVRPPNALDGVLSPETLDAIYEDARLHHALLSLTEAVAKASSDYGETYQSEGLKGFGKNLTDEVARIKAAQVPKKKRGFMEDMAGLLSGGGTGNGQEAGLGGLLGGGNSSGGLGGLLQQGIAGIGGDLVGGLATPAFFLGIGLGYVFQCGIELSTEILQYGSRDGP